MRKIDKDLAVIPDSLYTIGTKEGKKTDRKRRILMSSTSRYKNTYDECYKWKDIQDILAFIYRNKCAYCEEKINIVNELNIKKDNESLSEKELSDKKERLMETNHSVEHYRPKGIYPWLAFSWDNLLWCCTQCNKNKWNKFEIVNEKVEYDESFKEHIHSSTEPYNLKENPKMVHPELEDVMDKLVFDTNGHINSEDDRVKYTITTCGLDRNYLNGKRKEILVKLTNKFQDPSVQKNDEKKKEIIKKFKEDSENMDKEFIAFRIWVLNMFENI